MATGRVNVGGGGSGLNIYTQMTEPPKKEGIWVKTDKPYKNIINDLVLWFANSWNDESKKKYADTPYTLSGSCAMAVNGSNGTDIYIVGGGGVVGNQYYLHKYNVLTDKWTRLADIPDRFAGGKAVIVDGKLYAITSSNFASQNTVYCYDISLNQWTKPTNAPYAIVCGAVAVGSNIYVLGSTTSTYMKFFYKYNTLNNTWTKLTDYPGSFTYGGFVAIGTKLYALGGNSSKSSYCYDTELGSWSSALAPIPYDFTNGSAVAVGTDIYIMGGNFTTTTYRYFYKYNTLNNTWTRLTDSPYDLYTQVSGYSDNGIYVMGGALVTKNIKFNFQSKIYENGTVIIYRTDEFYGIYKAELITNAQKFEGVKTRILSGFDNVYMYLDGTLKENLPTYYGDGTKWVKFKGV